MITIEKKVVGLTPSQFFNKDDAGNEVPGGKTIQVQLQGGYSFRTKEGDDNFADVEDFVRTGSIVTVNCGDIAVSPYDSTENTPSGQEITVVKYYKNLEDVEIVDIKEPERKEKFKHLEKKADQLVFQHKEGRPRRQKRGASKPEEFTPLEGASAAEY